MPSPTRRNLSKALHLFVFVLSATVHLASHAYAEDKADDRTTRMLAQTTRDLERDTAALARDPGSVALLSHRGDCHLFLGHFAAAVADFEKMIALEPAQDAPHWRLGIAYYFAGDFIKSASQFEKYHAHDGGDRENGIWKFLAQARTLGLPKARASMLVYTRFDREPFPGLYEVFAGTRGSDDLFRELERKDLLRNEQVMFFANYYAGLNEALLGNRQRAIELVRKAVAGSWGSATEGSPTYMWQVARLHAARLEAGSE